MNKFKKYLEEQMENEIEVFYNGRNNESIYNYGWNKVKRTIEMLKKKNFEYVVKVDRDVFIEEPILCQTVIDVANKYCMHDLLVNTGIDYDRTKVKKNQDIYEVTYYFDDLKEKYEELSK